MIDRLKIYMTDNTEPCRNLALEEYLTLHAEPGECILYLWQNRKTVVIGRNQNAWKECSVSRLTADGGQIVRRLSGGGAVFHDLGNLNFTFCVRKDDYNVERQLGVIVEAARLLGVETEKTGRNDITVAGRKFSGNAFYEAGDFCYHHGTLMIGTDKEEMTRYLNVSPEKLKSRGVGSVRSRVANLQEFAPGLTVEEMKRALRDALENVYGCTAENFPEERLDAAEIEKSRLRFASWDWTFGKRIPFQRELSKRFLWGDIQLQLDVQGGAVRQANVFSDGMRQEWIAAIPSALEGRRYAAADLAEAVQGVPAADQMEEEMRGDIIGLLREAL